MKYLFALMLTIANSSLLASQIDHTDWCDPTYCCNPTKAE